MTLHGKTLVTNQVPNGVDVILTAHAYYFVKKEAREKVGLAWLATTLLPKYKGKHTFDNGDKMVGGSLYQLDDGWDTGQVLAQRSVMVDDNDTLTSLWQEKLAPMGLDLFKEFLVGLS